MKQITKLNPPFVTGALLLIWPFFGLVYGWINRRHVRFDNTIWIFSVFFGLAFTISSDIVDASRYAYWLESYHHSNYSYLELLRQVFSGLIGRGDYYEILVSITIAQFTANYKVLFAFFALVFGYFYSRSICMVLEKIKFSSPILLIPLILLLFFINPIWNVNGVRFYTAAQVFVFGFLLLYVRGSKYGYLFILLSPLFHFSFLFLVSIFILGRLLATIGSILLIPLMLSAIFAFTINPLEYLYFLENIGGFLGDKIFRYTHEEYIKNMSQQKTNAVWFIRYSEEGVKFVCLYTLTTILLFWKQTKFNGYSTYLIVLLSMVVGVTFAQSIPSMSRFYIPILFLVIALFLIIAYDGGNFKRKQYLAVPIIPVSVLISIVSVRLGMAYYGPTMFFSNFLIEPFLIDVPTFYK